MRCFFWKVNKIPKNKKKFLSIIFFIFSTKIIIESMNLLKKKSLIKKDYEFHIFLYFRTLNKYNHHFYYWIQL